MAISMKDNVNDKILPHLTDYTKDDLKNIINDNLQSYGKQYQKINIYNKNINVPLQKIWLLMPQVKIFKNVTFYANVKNTFPLTVMLGPNTGEIRKFYLFIKKIERHVQAIVKDITKKKSIQIRPATKSAEGFPPLMNLKMPSEKKGENCYELKFQIYNGHGQRIAMNSLTQGSYASAFIELKDVWISETEFGFNWTILQLQVIPEFNFSEYMFKDKYDPEDDTINNVVEECYHCMYCPNAHVRTHICNNSISNNNYQMFAGPIPPPPPPPPVIPYRESKLLTTTEDSDKKKPVVAESKGFAISIDQILSVKLRSVNKNKVADPDDPEENNQSPTNSDLEMLSNIRNNLKQNKD